MDYHNNITSTLALNSKDFYYLDESAMDFPWSQKDWDNLLLALEGYYLSWININYELVAFALYQLSGDQAHLLKIATHKDKRKAGISTTLIENDLKCMISKGFSSIYLEVDTINQPALKLYEKYGFNIIQTKTKFYSNGHDAYAMLKNLQK